MRVNRKRLCQACRAELEQVERTWLTAKREASGEQSPPDNVDVFLYEMGNVAPPTEGKALDPIVTYRNYKHWCDLAGVRAHQRMLFNRRMKERGFPVVPFGALESYHLPMSFLASLASPRIAPVD